MQYQTIPLNIIEKLENGLRINEEEALLLYTQASLQELGVLASNKKQSLFGKNVFFNRNIHIETSNICTNKCKFCSFYRDEQTEGAWEYSIEELLHIIDDKYSSGITEIHIVGSLHPEKGIEFFSELFKQIKKHWPDLHIKSFTAVEIEHISIMSDKSIEVCIKELQASGMDSVAGGGAEIFDEGIRKQLCPDKTSSTDWIKIHETLHKLGIASNCTMLYGHIENYKHRIDHMSRLRDLQDKTKGFNCFIPLKYKHAHNELGLKNEVNISEDLRNYAVSRLFLDNIPHLKAYWPMIGKDTALLALSFGADDMDGTINDSTRIYSMAGADEKKPTITASKMREMITHEGMIPFERDTLFNIID